MGWLITLGILILLGILPLGASVKYDAEGPLVKVIAGPVRITVFPRDKKPKKEKNQKKSKKEPEKTEPSDHKPVETAQAEPAKKSEPAPKPAESKAERSAPPKEEKKKSGGPITDFLPLLKVALDLLNDFRRKLRINRLEVKLVMAGGDPCDLAVNYGKAWTAIGNLLPRLEKVLVIKKRDIDVECDFTASQTTIYARLDLTITLGRILAIVVVYGFRAVVEFLKIKNKRKGGASK